MTIEDRIRALPCWQGAVQAEPLGGGITNKNYLVRDGARSFVVRIGDDIPVHHIMRFNEVAASIAAHAAGVSPAIFYHGPGVLVIDYIEGRTMAASDLRDDAMLDQAVALIARAHRTIPLHFRGAALTFWVFHVIRDYVSTLSEQHSRHTPLLPGLIADAVRLEAAVGKIDLIFGHNDLLPANFLHDGHRMWLIDWDYAGFNSPLFDLGGLAANCDLSLSQETRMLHCYFDCAPDPALWHAYRAMKAAAALRETLWSMVSERHSALDFDYAAYTATYLDTYRAALAAFEDNHG